MLDRRDFLKTVGLATAPAAEILGEGSLRGVAETQKRNDQAGDHPRDSGRAGAGPEL